MRLLGRVTHMFKNASEFMRRRFIGGASTALAASAIAAGQSQQNSSESKSHTAPNEEEPGPKNAALDAENPSSVWSPKTDNGTVAPFKYSFSLAKKRIESGGWTRQVTARELPVSKTIAGVEM